MKGVSVRISERVEFCDLLFLGLRDISTGIPWSLYCCNHCIPLFLRITIDTFPQSIAAVWCCGESDCERYRIRR